MGWITLGIIIGLFIIIAEQYLQPITQSKITLVEDKSKTLLQRYVSTRSCPKECKDQNHKTHKVIVQYHLPILGAYKGEGTTEQEADKEAKIKLSAALSTLYLDKTKDLMQLEKLMEQVK